jgi:hypothetical protein
MASYGVSLVLLTVGRGWHLYGRRMRTTATLVKPDGEQENVKIVAAKDAKNIENKDNVSYITPVDSLHTKGE